MDLHHLKYVLVAAEEGSFTRASARLGVAPSALSRRIQDLEAELGVALFERAGGAATLSAAGRILIGHASRIFAEIEAAAAHLRRLRRGQTDILRLALNGIAPQLDFIPALCGRFRATRPRIELQLRSMASGDQLRALRHGEIDAGILYTRPEHDAGFAHLRLASHRFVLALPAAHPLAGRARLLLRDLADEDFVMFSAKSGPAIHAGILRNCRDRGLAPRIVQETSGEHLQLGLVAAGLGVSFVNESAVARQHRPDIAIRPVDDLIVHEHLDLTWLADRVPPSLASFIALARPHATASFRDQENSLVFPALCPQDSQTPAITGENQTVETACPK